MMTDELALSSWRVLVVGMGVMGRGIARCFARAGADVLITDSDKSTTANAFSMLLNEAGDDGSGATWNGQGSIAMGTIGDAISSHLVVEAVVEDMAAKAAVLSSLAQHAGAETVLGTNTSSLSVAELGRASGLAARTIGLHFFNPPEKMSLVEVVVGPETEPAALDVARRAVIGLMKVPVVCRDSPGFIVNRTCRPLYYEAQLLVSEGMPAAAVDAVARHGLGFRMGPLETLDLSGLHVHVAASETALPRIWRSSISADSRGPPDGPCRPHGPCRWSWLL